MLSEKPCLGRAAPLRTTRTLRRTPSDFFSTVVQGRKKEASRYFVTLMMPLLMRSWRSLAVMFCVSLGSLLWLRRTAAACWYEAFLSNFFKM